MGAYDANALAAADAAAGGTPPADAGTPPADNATPPADGGTPPEPSGLPSDNAGDQKSPWERAREEGLLPDDFKEDPYELAKSWKNAQEFVAEANKEKGKFTAEQNKAAENALVQEQILEMVPEFMKNGMQLSEEMETKATELNIDIRDLKLGAMEMKENITNMYNVVGGEETYGQMMTDMAEHMSDSQKKAFNASIGSSVSEYAIKGLYAEWQGTQGGKPNGRLEGSVKNNSSVKPYGTKQEMMADLRYLKTKGKTDRAARAKYEARKGVTPDAVVMG